MPAPRGIIKAVETVQINHHGVPGRDVSRKNIRVCYRQILGRQVKREYRVAWFSSVTIVSIVTTPDRSVLLIRICIICIQIIVIDRKIQCHVGKGYRTVIVIAVFGC